MSPWFRVVFAWCLLRHHSAAVSIDCTTKQCQNTIIDCLPNQNCFVSCDDTQACIASVINCPAKGDCDILCSGGQSCQDAVINATSSSGNFNLLCEHSADDCKGIRVYGSTLVNNKGNFNVLCDGSARSCAYSHIHCPVSGDCSVSCNADTSCRWSQISGPSIEGDLSIHCNGERSCFDAILNGKLSSSLHINGCSASQSCSDITLYCPPNTNGIKNCFIEGNNNIARDDNGGTIIYAINGFDDLEIDFFGTFDAKHGGQMFCGKHYDISCNIKADDWSCADADSICNGDHTMAPSSSPTTAATNLNITSIYSIDPATFSRSTSVTILYTTHAHDDSHDSHGDHSHDHPVYEFKKDRGITWLLEVRIVFGCGVLITILIVGLCCYLFNRNKHDDDDDPLHHDMHKVPHLTSASLSRYYSRTYTHHSCDDREDRHPYSERSKTMEVDDTYQLNAICNDILSDPVDPFSRTNTFNREHVVQHRDSITPHNSYEAEECDEAAVPLKLNPIQAEILAVRQLLTLRSLVLQKKEQHNRDISEVGSADTVDIAQRNRFDIKPYISCSEGFTPTHSHSATVSPKTPMLPTPISSTMTTFNLNDVQRQSESRKPMTLKQHLSPKRSLHQRNQGGTIKPDVVNEIVHKLGNKNKNQKRHKNKSNTRFQLQCPGNNKSVSISIKKNKSPSSKKQERKITLISMTTQKSQRSYGSMNVNDSETEMGSCSESSNAKTKTLNESSTNIENTYSETETYEPSDDPIPTAC